MSGWEQQDPYLRERSHQPDRDYYRDEPRRQTRYDYQQERQQPVAPAITYVVQAPAFEGEKLMNPSDLDELTRFVTAYRLYADSNKQVGMQPQKPSTFMHTRGYQKVISQHRNRERKDKGVTSNITEQSFPLYSVQEQLDVLFDFITPLSASQFAERLRHLAKFGEYARDYNPSMANFAKYFFTPWMEYCKRFKQAYLLLAARVDDEHRLPYQQSGNSNTLQEIFFGEVPNEVARTVWQLLVPEHVKKQMRDIIPMIETLEVQFDVLDEHARKHDEYDTILLNKQPRYRGGLRKAPDLRYVEEDGYATVPKQLLVRGTTTLEDMPLHALKGVTVGSRDKPGQRRGNGTSDQSPGGCFRKLMQPPYTCTLDAYGKCNYQHDTQTMCATWYHQYAGLEASPYAPESLVMQTFPTTWKTGDYKPRGPIVPHDGLLLSKEGHPADRRDLHPAVDFSYMHSTDGKDYGPATPRRGAWVGDGKDC